MPFGHNRITETSQRAFQLFFSNGLQWYPQIITRKSKLSVSFYNLFLKLSCFIMGI